MNSLWNHCFLACIGLLLAGCPYPEGNFSAATIERVFETPEEAALIEIAEQVCPSREAVLSVAASDERAALETEGGDGCLWWYGYDNGPGGGWRLPYAVTLDAVEYYAARVDQCFAAGAAAPDAYFDYVATIEFQSNFIEGEKAFQNVYLVTLSMAYTEDMRGTGHGRRVILTGEGEVLAVFGDGPAEPIYIVVDYII